MISVPLGHAKKQTNEKQTVFMWHLFQIYEHINRKVMTEIEKQFSFSMGRNNRKCHHLWEDCCCIYLKMSCLGMLYRNGVMILKQREWMCWSRTKVFNTSSFHFKYMPPFLYLLLKHDIFTVYMDTIIACMNDNIFNFFCLHKWTTAMTTHSGCLVLKNTYYMEIVFSHVCSFAYLYVYWWEDLHQLNLKKNWNLTS